jgi:hypothetical protein
MKHVTYAANAVLVDDDAADALLEYARVLADSGRADTVTLRAIRPDGNTVDASFLLNASTVMMIESTDSDRSPPRNEHVVIDLRDRIASIDRPARTEYEAPWVGEDLNLGESF